MLPHAVIAKPRKERSRLGRIKQIEPIEIATEALPGIVHLGWIESAIRKPTQQPGIANVMGVSWQPGLSTSHHLSASL
jgi:hypothetical protein